MKKTANRPTIYREQRQLGKIQSPQFPEKEKKLEGASQGNLVLVASRAFLERFPSFLAKK